MEFDKRKVYTTLNADELKGGVKVIVADTLERLKSRVRENDVSKWSGRLLSVWPEDYEYRFQFEDKEKYALAYLVEEPEEQEWLKWTDLKVGDVIRSPSMIDYMVTGINRRRDTKNCHILVGESWLTDELLKYWEKIE